MSLTRREWILSLLSAALLAVAFPPLPTAPLAWIALVPLILALEGRSPRHALKIGYVFGAFYHLATLYWIAFHTEIDTYLAVVGWIAASLILALYTMLAPYVTRLSAKWVGAWWPWTLPFTWVAAEYLRFHTELAFPWSTIGHSQAHLLGIIQQADTWGVIGVSFWLVAMNVIAYEVYHAAPISQRRAFQWAGVFVLVLMATFTYGRFRLNERPQKPPILTVAIVQPNIPMNVKWEEGGNEKSQAVYRELTQSIDPRGIDLVIWPETALPDYTVYNPPGEAFHRIVNPRYRYFYRSVIEHTNTPLATGTPVYDYRTYDAYNSTVVIMPDSLTVQTYEKRSLVPFGERVPYSTFFGWLDKFNLGIAHWAPGERNVTLGVNGYQFGAAICFESVFPRIVSDFVDIGADFLVVVTNDAWFGNTSLIYQHADFAAFRAIESRTWIARAANTGISGIYDPWGRRIAEADVFTRDVVVGSIGPRERNTPYLILGDWIAWLSLGVSVVLIVGGVWERRQVRKSLP